MGRRIEETLSLLAMMLPLLPSVVLALTVPARGDNSAKNARIVNYQAENFQDGYFFRFATNNGIEREEVGKVFTGEANGRGTMATEGRVMWKTPEGAQMEVHFHADENGFQPRGVHLVSQHWHPIADLPPIEEDYPMLKSLADGTLTHVRFGEQRDDDGNVIPMMNRTAGLRAVQDWVPNNPRIARLRARAEAKRTAAADKKRRGQKVDTPAEPQPQVNLLTRVDPAVAGAPLAHILLFEDTGIDKGRVARRVLDVETGHRARARVQKPLPDGMKVLVRVTQVVQKKPDADGKAKMMRARLEVAARRELISKRRETLAARG